MMYCTPEARAACPSGHLCEPQAFFTDDSECAKFVTQVAARLAAGRMTRLQKLQTLSVDAMAELLMQLDDCERIQYCDGHCTAEGMRIEDLTHDMCKSCMIRYLQDEGEILLRYGLLQNLSRVRGPAGSRRNLRLPAGRAGGAPEGR